MVEKGREEAPARSATRSAHGGFYRFTVDTIASATFFTPLAMANEIFVTGLSFRQSIKTRAIGLVINGLAGRPYGKFRDYALGMLRIDETSAFRRKYFADVAVLSVFWAPVYAGVLAISGVDERGIAVASGIGLLSNFVTGRPYGVYLEWLRRKAGVGAERGTIASVNGSAPRPVGTLD